MATTTTSKAKTKTSNKKPATKRAVRSTKAAAKTRKPASKVAAKSVKKPAKVSAKSVAAASSKSSLSGRFSFLRRGQIRLAAVYTALAVAAGFLMNTSSAQVLLGHLAKDELESRSGTVLAPAVHALYEVEFRWLLVALLVASAVIAILRATRYYRLEQAGSVSGAQPLRWVEFAITGALAFEIVALLNGLQDAAALKLAMVSIAVAALLAWSFERENSTTTKPARLTYVTSAIAVAIPVIALLITMYGTYVYGMERSPWYAYAAAAVVGLGLLVTVRSVWNNFKVGKTLDAVRINRNYNRVAVLSKVALAVILIVGLYAK
jgi:hypothetical protein